MQLLFAVRLKFSNRKKNGDYITVAADKNSPGTLAKII